MKKLSKKEMKAVEGGWALDACFFRALKNGGDATIMRMEFIACMYSYR